MNSTFRIAAGMACLFALTGTFAAESSCEPDGDVCFFCGLKAPEDLVAVPDSDWVLVSGMADIADPTSHRGELYAVSARGGAWKALYPLPDARVRHDRKLYADCPGPLPDRHLGAHGLDIRRGQKGVHTLYVVNHSDRESFEVFELDVNSTTPVLTWVGCVIYPEKTSGNGIVALPDGGIATTNFKDPADANAFQRMTAREITGNVLEWHPGKGWSVIPDSDMSGPNGILVSPDGKSLYVAGWPTKDIVRFERGAASPRREVIQTGILTDNLRWNADGTILAGGQDGDMPGVFQCPAPKCLIASAAVRVDPRTLRAERIVTYAGTAGYDGATTALQVGDEIWMGSFRGERIARVPLKQ